MEGNYGRSPYLAAFPLTALVKRKIYAPIVLSHNVGGAQTAGFVKKNILHLHRS